MSYNVLLIKCHTPWSVLVRPVLSTACPSSLSTIEWNSALFINGIKCTHKIHNGSEKKELAGQQCCHLVQIKSERKWNNEK